jgi:hypothetical protein
MKPRLAVLFSILIVAGFSSGARAAVSHTFSFEVARAPHPLPLDPAMADPAWTAGRVPGDEPWANITTRRPAGDPTVAYLLYDDKNLYVGFVVQQPSAPIVATQETNDVGFGKDDFVGIGIDTSGAGSQAYFFETTPRGVRYQQASENVRFRPDWQSTAKVEGSTWRADMIIPLRAMRVRPAPVQSWRIEFFRSIAARAEHVSWTYDPLMQDLGAGNWPSFNDLRFWPRATGIAVKSSALSKPQPRLELFGLSSSGRDRELYQQANGSFQTERTRAVGADLSYPLTATINFVGTANPDFSNVEIDQQTIAPQEFARQLAEYRPFFAQGAQYLNPSVAGYTNFNAPNNEVFYSPSVGPFDSGAKIEGTYGLQSFGILTFRGFNQVTGETFDDQAMGYHHLLQDGTFQYWADGVLAHHSITGDDSTYEFGGRVRNLQNGLLWQFNSDIEDGSLVPQGIAHSTDSAVDVHKANYEAIVQYADISPGYNPVDGFTTISDIRGPSGYLNLNGSTPGVKSWSLFFQGDRLLDRSGAVHQADSNVFFNAVFKNGFSVNGLGPSTSELREYGGNFFTGYPTYKNGLAVPFNFMGVPIGYGDGTPAPIDVSANWGSFGGNWLHLYTAQTSRPIGSRYTLGLEYDGSFQRGLTSGALDSQWLRRVSLGFNMGSSSNLTLALRDINGRGGFSPQLGLNLAAAFHTRTKDGDLYVNYGSPSASATLNRLIIKYVLRIGADAGT